MPTSISHRPVRFATLALFVLLAALQPAASTAAGNATLFLPMIATGYDAEWRWNASPTLEVEPFPAKTPLASLDAGGRLHLLWEAAATPHQLYHAMWEGAAWSQPAPVAALPGISTLLYRPIQGAGDALHLLWRYAPGDGSYRLLFATYAGGGWSAAQEIYRTGESDVKGILRLGADGLLRAVTTEDVPGTHVLQFTNHAGRWDASPLIQVGHAVSALWPDAAGGIHFYGPLITGHHFYSYWRDGQLVVDERSIESSTKIYTWELDGASNLHIYWLAEAAGANVAGAAPAAGAGRALHHHCLDKNLVWQPLAVASQGETVSDLPVAAADASPRFAMLWTEEGETPIHRVGVWEECNPITAAQVPLDGSLSLRTIAWDGAAERVCAVAGRRFTASYSAVCGQYLGQK